MSQIGTYLVGAVHCHELSGIKGLGKVLKLPGTYSHEFFDRFESIV